MNFACKLKLSIMVSLYQHELTDWEENFVNALKGKTEFTPNQVSKVAEIWKAVRKGNRTFYPKAELEPMEGAYSPSLGVSYDDVHDFDK